MSYLSTKSYPHSLGLSACFRQWRATHSHCSKLHGYALAFKIIFECDTLDDKNWCVDFGGLKEVKQFLVNTFDHKLAIAEDDPERDLLEELDEAGIADVIILPSVGCEAFAKQVYDFVESFLQKHSLSPRVTLHSVECREHEGNSAIYAREDSVIELSEMSSTQTE